MPRNLVAEFKPITAKEEGLFAHHAVETKHSGTRFKPGTPGWTGKINAPNQQTALFTTVQ